MATAVQGGHSVRATQPMRKHRASDLRAPQAIENGALRHKQHHAGSSDGPVVFLQVKVLHELSASSVDQFVSGFA